MIPIDVTDIIIVLTIPVLIVRLVVRLSRSRSLTTIITFALPTVALLFFLVRVSITRNFASLIRADDWVSTLSWAGLFVTQAVAAVYQWIPQSVLTSRKGHWDGTTR
jgi:hypothetical protein